MIQIDPSIHLEIVDKIIDTSRVVDIIFATNNKETKKKGISIPFFFRCASYYIIPVSTSVSHLHGVFSNLQIKNKMEIELSEIEIVYLFYIICIPQV